MSNSSEIHETVRKRKENMLHEQTIPNGTLNAWGTERKVEHKEYLEKSDG